MRLLLYFQKVSELIDQFCQVVEKPCSQSEQGFDLSEIPVLFLGMLVDFVYTVGYA